MPCRSHALRLLLVAAILATSGAPAHAETLAIRVPSEGWSVTFSLPEPVEMVEKAGSGKFYSVGAGSRFSVSLFVGPPTCKGATNVSAAYQCMRPKVRTIPGVIEQTVSVDSRPGNIQVSYIQYAKTGDVAAKVVHTHVLFEKDGMWGDLHASVVKPTQAEVAALFAVGDQFELR